MPKFVHLVNYNFPFFSGNGQQSYRVSVLYKLNLLLFSVTPSVKKNKMKKYILYKRTSVRDFKILRGYYANHVIKFSIHHAKTKKNTWFVENWMNSSFFKNVNPEFLDTLVRSLWPFARLRWLCSVSQKWGGNFCKFNIFQKNVYDIHSMI